MDIEVEGTVLRVDVDPCKSEVCHSPLCSFPKVPGNLFVKEDS